MRRRGQTSTVLPAGALGCAAVLALSALAAHAQEGPADKPPRPDDLARKRASAVLSVLEDDGAAARTHFDDPERRTWAFGPVQREGADLNAFDDPAEEALGALLDTVLSEAGLAALAQIRDLEDVLFERESRPDKPATHRDRMLYWLRVYGDPKKAAAAWGWRFEGHHFALHVAYDAAGAATVTPFFLGANPLTGVPGFEDGAAVDVLGELTRLHARAFAAVDAKSARFEDGAKPADIRMGPGNDALPPEEGARLDALDEAAFDATCALVDAVEALLDEEHRTFGVAAALERVEGDTRAEFRFASTRAVALDAARAFCVRTPTFALEFVTTDGPHHVHVVLRDVARDFGGPAGEERGR